MKILAVVLAVISLLFLAQMGQAADLQAGWYVKLYSVDYYGYNNQGIYSSLGGASFWPTSPGTYGPFTVSDGPYHFQYSRQVDVLTSVSGLSSTSSLILPLAPGYDSEKIISDISFMWETNYNVSQMVLEFWHDEDHGGQKLLWTQPLSSPQRDGAIVGYNMSFGNGFYFKVAVVPEPSSVLSLILGCGSLAYLAKKRA